MSLLPDLKKKISDFVFEEEGQISKGSLISLGIVATSFSTAFVASSNDVVARGCGCGCFPQSF